MRIAVSSQGCDMDSHVDPRFGRAQAFVIIDQDSGDITCLDNANKGLAQSAGIQTAQMVADSGAQAVLTGRVGPNAQAALQRAGLLVHAAPEGSTVREAVQAFTQGGLPSLLALNAAPGAGNTAMPTGTGQGPGRGMGGGCGRGMGGGRGRGMGGCGGGMGGGRGMGGGGTGRGPV